VASAYSMRHHRIRQQKHIADRTRSRSGLLHASISLHRRGSRTILSNFADTRSLRNLNNESGRVAHNWGRPIQSRSVQLSWVEMLPTVPSIGSWLEIRIPVRLTQNPRSIGTFPGLTSGARLWRPCGTRLSLPSFSWAYALG